MVLFYDIDDDVFDVVNDDMEMGVEKDDVNANKDDNDQDMMVMMAIYDNMMIVEDEKEV